MLRLAALALVLPVLGCLGGRRSPGVCSLSEPASAAGGEVHSAGVARTPIDASALKLYRNTFLVDRVGPYEHHFWVGYSYFEPNVAHVRAKIDPTTGRVSFAVDYETFGGGALTEGPPPPPEVADLTKALEREMRVRCPGGRRWAVRYEGQYREVDLVEMIAIKLDDSPPQFGWHGRLGLHADESLTRLVGGMTIYTSSLGVIAATEPAQWVDFVPPVGSTGTTFFLDRLANSKAPPSPDSAEAELTRRALDAARRLVTEQPSLPLADLLDAQGATLLPRGIDQPLLLDITFYARRRPELRDASQEELRLTLGLKTADAVHRLSRGEASGTVAGLHVRATAVLTPLHPVVAAAPPGRTEVAATLQVHVEDDEGHEFERSFPAKTDVVVDGDAVATVGFALSAGPASPTAKQDGAQSVGLPSAFQGTLPGKGPYSAVDFDVAREITTDPRRK